MDVVMRLYRLGLLPATVAALEGEDSQAAAMRLPRLAASRSAAAAPSLLSRAFLRCCSSPRCSQGDNTAWCFASFASNADASDRAVCAVLASLEQSLGCIGPQLGYYFDCCQLNAA